MKPHELHVIDGTDRGYHRNQPDPISYDSVFEMPSPPAGLGHHGVAMWLDLCEQMMKAKTLQLPDKYALHMVCAAWNDFREKQSAGVPLKPAENVALLSMLSALGCNPMARRKLTGTAPTPAAAVGKAPNRFASNRRG